MSKEMDTDMNKEMETDTYTDIDTHRDTDANTNKDFKHMGHHLIIFIGMSAQVSRFQGEKRHRQTIPSVKCQK
jgi:hypothetical protein